MAKDTKNESLVPQDELDRAKLLNAELRTLIEVSKQLLGGIEKVNTELATTNKTFDTYIKATKKVEENEKQLNDIDKERVRIMKERSTLSAKLSVSQSKEAKEVAALRVEVQKQNQVNRQAAKETLAAANSVAALAAKVARLKQEWRNMDSSMPDFKAKTKELRQANEELIKLEQSVKVGGRNVGNYPEGGIFSALSVFGGNLLTKAVAGIGKLVSKAKEFVAAGVEMASKADGVATAFNKLNAPNLLSNLQEATKGTVNNLLLMQSAVKAEKFGIPLNNLGSLLKFAQQRAQETGESIDYLTESIINGIGRKSKLILDNLGISAVRLGAEVKKTGDFTAATIAIVNEELEKQGTLALTSADKAQQARVKWENAQLAVGQRFKWLGDIWSGISGKMADEIRELAGENKSATQSYEEQIVKVVELEDKMVPLARRYDELQSKAELSKDEHEELRGIMATIGNAMPGVVTQWGEYNEVLSINTQAIYDNIEAERARLKVVNAKAIEEYTKKVEDASNRLANLQEAITDGGRYKIGADGFSAFVKWTEGELKELKANADQAAETLKGSQSQLNLLNGQSIEDAANAYREKTAQREEFNAMDKVQLEKWIENNRKANHEYLALAQQVYSQRFGFDLSGGSDKESKEREKAAKALAEAEKKAVQEVSQYVLSVEADKQKKIVSDQKKSYEERIDALEAFVEIQTDSINQSAQDQIENLIQKEMEGGKTREQAREGLTSQILLIETKAALESEKILEEKNATIIGIEEQYTQKLLKEFTKRAEAEGRKIDGDESAAFVDLSKEYSKGKMSAEEYEKRKLEITKEYALKRYQSEAQMLNDMLSQTGLTEEQRDEIKKKLLDSELAYTKYINGLEIKANEEKGKKEEDLQKEIEKKKRELMKETFDAVFKMLSAQVDAAAEKQLAALDEESERNSEHYDAERDRIDRLYEAGAISKEQADARKMAADSKERENEKKIEEERKKVQERQAKYQKALSIAQIMVNTGLAVMMTLATTPFPTNLIMAKIVAAMGAIQLATAIATPIPKYAKGTSDHPGGPAVLGDAGRHEMIVTPDGHVFKSPKVGTVMDLPEHSMVLPDYKEALRQMAFVPLPGSPDKGPVVVIDIERLAGLQEENVKVLKSIRTDQAKSRKGQLYGNNFKSKNLSKRWN